MHRPHVLVLRRVPAAVLAGVVMVSTAGPAALAQSTPVAARRDTRPTVAVMYFDNSALKNHADYDPLRRGMADMIITELSRNAAIRVVERDQIQKLLEEQNLSTSGRIDQATALRVGKVLGAHHLLLGSFFIDPRGRQLRLDARAVHTETSQVEYVETVSGKADDLLDLVAALAAKMNKGMRLPQMAVANPVQPPAGGRPPAGGQPAGTPAGNQAGGGSKVARAPAQPRQHRGGEFQALMLFSRALAEEDRGNVGQAITLYKATLSQLPDYVPAQQKLARLQRAG